MELGKAIFFWRRMSFGENFFGTNTFWRQNFRRISFQGNALSSKIFFFSKSVHKSVEYRRVMNTMLCFIYCFSCYLVRVVIFYMLNQ